MKLPIAASLDLKSATRLIATHAGTTTRRARAALVEAAINDEIAATGCLHQSTAYREASVDAIDCMVYFGAPLGDRRTVPAQAWAEAIAWQRNRGGWHGLDIDAIG